jgi:hypothetical protein
MAWTPKEQEVAALLAADGARRYEYFIHRVCDTRKVWALYQDGWASLGDGEQKLIPFWPHPVFATRFATGDWTGYSPREIELEAFLKQWIPGLATEGIEAAIFPNSAGSAVIVGLADLEANLRHELAESYGEEP